MFQMSAFIFYLIHVLAIGLIIFTFWYTRKQILKHDKSNWKAIKWPLLASLVPLLFILHYAMAILFSMGPLNRFPYIIKLIALLFLSSIIFALGLWYKNLFSLKRLAVFIKGLLIAFLGCVLIIGLSIGIQQFLLRKDPAYLKMLQQNEEIEKRIREKEANL
jgi:hypothetical protein